MEVIGVGTDVVDVPRFRAVLARTPTIVDRLFTDGEKAWCERKTDPAERYAVRFAAKEAVGKAMRTGLSRFPIRQIEVIRGENGEPTIELGPKGQKVAKELGIGRFEISLSHSETTAIAVCVAVAG